jgi:hypothetical protein
VVVYHAAKKEEGKRATRKVENSLFRKTYNLWYVSHIFSNSERDVQQTAVEYMNLTPGLEREMFQRVQMASNVVTIVNLSSR